ncbi:unnamed protein product [Tenebrio molitor]|nr:unnamed protein product [Tenebrio molitor]
MSETCRDDLRGLCEAADNECKSWKSCDDKSKRTCFGSLNG